MSEREFHILLATYDKEWRPYLLNNLDNQQNNRLLYDVIMKFCGRLMNRDFKLSLLSKMPYGEL